MDIREGNSQKKYDTYVDLNFPAMKSVSRNNSDTEKPLQNSKSPAAPVVLLGRNERAEQDMGGGFNFHLGGLRRG